ncbi:MAG: hypothetical protein ABIQ31_04805 [Ferruginibacter sp.]
MERAKKILLVELCANGDCLYATTVARQIKNDYPDCQLTWAIAGIYKPIISGNPYVDAIMEVNDAPKNNLAAFRKFKKRIFLQKKRGEWDEIFITQVIDDNAANYDGCIRSATFRGYKNKITVPVTPVLRINGSEKLNVEQFSESHDLSKYKHVILFEFSPLSGQAKITKEDAFKIAEELVNKIDAVVILSSGDKVFHSDPRIIDGSHLTLRETAMLSNHCTFLLGCSSGITWASTSDAGRNLPMVQLLSADSLYTNSVARDFERQGLTEYDVIEITNHETGYIVACILSALSNFEVAKKRYHVIIPVSFATSRIIVCNLFIHLQFKSILKHIKINREVYGDKFSFYKECIIGIFIAPVMVSKFFLKKINR